MKELLRKYYKINKTQSKLLFEIVKSRNMGLTMEDLVTLVNKERTTLSKALQLLLKKKLIHYKQENMATGFRYVYYSINEKELKQTILNSIEDKYKNDLDEFNKDF